MNRRKNPTVYTVDQPHVKAWHIVLIIGLILAMGIADSLAGYFG